MIPELLALREKAFKEKGKGGIVPGRRKAGGNVQKGLLRPISPLLKEGTKREII